MMLSARLALAVCLIAGSAYGDAAEFRSRRQALRESIEDGAVVLFGRTGADRDGLSTFRQEANFEYLSGWREPGAALMILPGTAKGARETLFLPRRNERLERYTGRKASADDAGIREVSGFEQAVPLETLESRLAEALAQFPRVYTLVNEPFASKLRALAPLREVHDVEAAIARLRLKKSDSEIALIRRATAVTVEGHRAAWKRIAPGLHEYQVAATMTAVYLENNCENAYPPIVASGPNGPVLHYSANGRRFDRGELVLMDVGAQCAGYASDVTRTVPATGRFTARQRELYNLVLGAQKAVIAAIRPGMIQGAASDAPNSMWKVAHDYLESHGGYGKYLTHGVSHSVGLRVHDGPAEFYSRPLEPGMVITVEPGVYIPAEGIGIRIEDIVVVRQDGADVLSADLPKEAAEIEKAMAK